MPSATGYTAMPYQFNQCLYLKHHGGDAPLVKTWTVEAEKLLKKKPLASYFQHGFASDGGATWRVNRIEGRDDRLSDWIEVKAYLEARGYEYKGEKDEGVVFQLKN